MTFQGEIRKKNDAKLCLQMPNFISNTIEIFLQSVLSVLCVTEGFHAL